MHVIHSDKALVLTFRSLFRPAIRLGLVVAILFAAVLDDRVENANVGRGMIGVRGKNADSVARKVPDVRFKYEIFGSSSLYYFIRGVPNSYDKEDCS
ncbi:MAG: hypothetical protein JXM79_23340 [Sedimentisphaerales bacterium]|nr:hypothetical protein [Sedimentisphaerales bacterium]